MKDLLANANGVANEIAKALSSLWTFLATGSLRQNPVAIANAMAWCTQHRMTRRVMISQDHMQLRPAHTNHFSEPSP